MRPRQIHKLVGIETRHRSQGGIRARFLSQERRPLAQKAMEAGQKQAHSDAVGVRFERDRCQLQAFPPDSPCPVAPPYLMVERTG